MTTSSPSAFPTEDDSGIADPEPVSEPTNSGTDSYQTFTSQASQAASVSTGGVIGQHLVIGLSPQGSTSSEGVAEQAQLDKIAQNEEALRQAELKLEDLEQELQKVKQEMKQVTEERDEYKAKVTDEEIKYEKIIKEKNLKINELEKKLHNIQEEMKSVTELVKKISDNQKQTKSVSLGDSNISAPNVHYEPHFHLETVVTNIQHHYHYSDQSPPTSELGRFRVRKIGGGMWITSG